MDLKDTVLRALNELVKNGGEGSGDFGHAGNPPHVGGSEPVGSRHARGFKSKSERKEVKKKEKKPTFKPVKGIIQTLKYHQQPLLNHLFFFVFQDLLMVQKSFENRRHLLFL